MWEWKKRKENEMKKIPKSRTKSNFFNNSSSKKDEGISSRAFFRWKSLIGGGATERGIWQRDWKHESERSKRVWVAYFNWVFLN